MYYNSCNVKYYSTYSINSMIWVWFYPHNLTEIVCLILLMLSSAIITAFGWHLVTMLFHIFYQFYDLGMVLPSQSDWNCLFDTAYAFFSHNYSIWVTFGNDAVPNSQLKYFCFAKKHNDDWSYIKSISMEK